jgi:ABC-type phosphate transport system substrate-binding protein
MVRSAMLTLCVVLLVGIRPGAAQQRRYKVIVNASNNVSTITRDYLSQLFLKKTSRWANGQVALPVNLPSDSPVRESFAQNVHGRSVSAIRAYWQRMVFSGGAVPPEERNSDSAVIAYVAANANAIGYVSAGASVDGGIKVIQVGEGGVP